MIIEKNKLNINLLYFVFFLFGLFPILPFNLKPITVISSVIVGIFCFIKQKKINFSPYYISNGIVFILYFTSLLYSSDQHYAFKKLETTASIILLPLFFLMISNVDIKLRHLIIIETIFFITFYLSAVILCITIYFYIYSLGYYDNLVSYNYCMSYIEHRLWVFNDHPIYLSIFIALSLIFSVNLIINASGKKIKIILLLCNILLIGTLVFLSRKGVIIASLASFLYLILKTIKSSKKILIYILLILGILSCFYLLLPSSSSRIKEVFSHETYTKSINDSNSTSIRLGIYKCTMESLSGAGFFGYGIGDVKDVLYNCYHKTSTVLVKGKYNTHNQYFNLWLVSGLFGLTFFLFFLFNLFKLSIKSNDYMFTSILIFYLVAMAVENILERQNGVILFSFIINYYTYKNISISAIKIKNV